MPVLERHGNTGLMFVIGAELVQVLQWKDAVIERWVVPQEFHQGSGVMPNGIHLPVRLQASTKLFRSGSAGSARVSLA